jgi:hypothetical protein
MNSVERAALLVHRDTIVQDVDFNYIKEKLLAYSILNHEELEEIDYEVSERLKTNFPFWITRLNFILENTICKNSEATGYATPERPSKFCQFCQNFGRRL